jgi:hypothetical protein
VANEDKFVHGQIGPQKGAQKGGETKVELIILESELAGL